MSTMPKNIAISSFSNGQVVVYIKDKRYKYYVNDMARLEFLKNKLKRAPGKLFNEIKKMGELING
jgi:hypothetical protein